MCLKFLIFLLFFSSCKSRDDRPMESNIDTKTEASMKIYQWSDIESVVVASKKEEFKIPKTKGFALLLEPGFSLRASESENLFQDVAFAVTSVKTVESNLALNRPSKTPSLKVHKVSPSDQIKHREKLNIYTKDYKRSDTDLRDDQRAFQEALSRGQLEGSKAIFHTMQLKTQQLSKQLEQQAVEYFKESGDKQGTRLLLARRAFVVGRVQTAGVALKELDEVANRLQGTYPRARVRAPNAPLFERPGLIKQDVRLLSKSHIALIAVAGTALIGLAAILTIDGDDSNSSSESENLSLNLTKSAQEYIVTGYPILASSSPEAPGVLDARFEYTLRVVGVLQEDLTELNCDDLCFQLQSQ